MRKVFVSVALLMLAIAGTMQAQNVNLGSDAIEIPLIWNDVPPINSNPPKPKIPHLMPCVYLNGYTLYVGERFVGFTLELVQDECVCYQHSILLGEETVSLPESLTGDFTIRFFDVDGNVYVGLLSFDYLD